MRRFTTLLTALAVLLGLAAPAPAQDRVRAKEVIVAFAAEPRTLLPNTIVDWTTNNMVEHMYDRLVDRDAKTYKPIPDAGHRLEGREQHHVGVHAAPGREVPQRRALRRPVRQGHDGLHQGPGEQDALRAALGAGEGGPDRRRLHGALHHREAVARPHRPHLAGHATSSRCRPRRSRSRASRRSSPSRSAPGRSSSRSGCATRSSWSCATTTTGRAKAELKTRDVPLHPRVQRAAGRAPGRRDRHHEGRAAARRGDARQERQGHGARARCPRASTTSPWSTSSRARCRTSACARPSTTPSTWTS